MHQYIDRFIPCVSLKINLNNIIIKSPEVIENKLDPIISNLFALDGEDYIGHSVQSYFDATFFQEKSDSILKEKFKTLINDGGKALMLISKSSLTAKINIPCLFIYELNVIKQEKATSIQICNYFTKIRSIGISFNKDRFDFLENVIKIQSQNKNLKKIKHIFFPFIKLAPVFTHSYSLFMQFYKTPMFGDVVKEFKDYEHGKVPGKFAGKHIINGGSGSINAAKENVIKILGESFVEKISLYDCIPDVELFSNIIYKYK
ncbi:MAG: hypothetical protein K2P99_01770 [Burkholderiales bacterium]|nr:hypothetical protein [Burkholderiales bacterium]